MKPVVFSMHATERLAQRGTNEQEVRAAIANGTRKPARDEKIRCR